MQRRPLLVAALGSLLSASAGASMQSDRIPLPPARRELRSANGQWLLRLEAVDPSWNTTEVVATLLSVAAGGGETLRWRLPLAHAYGPRDAWLGADGQVLLIDEWINVASPRALVLIAADGRAIATHSHAAIVAALGSSSAQVARHAKRGVWWAGGPRLTDDSTQLRFEAAGQALLMRLRDGALSRQPTTTP